MASDALGVQVLQYFSLTSMGLQVELPAGAERLVAYLALSAAPTHRAALSAALWPERDSGRAAGNLRTLLWRLRDARPGLLSADRGQLTLAPTVDVDLAHRRSQIEALIRVAPDAAEAGLDAGGLSQDILT